MIEFNIFRVQLQMCLLLFLLLPPFWRVDQGVSIITDVDDETFDELFTLSRLDELGI